jgi:acetyl esterase/lipase
MPSLRHQFYAFLVPKITRAQEMGDEPIERARILREQATRTPEGRDGALPTRLVPRFEQRFSVVEEQVAGFSTYVITPRHVEPRRTLFYLHGGSFLAPAHPIQVRYAARLASALDARIVFPDYPLSPTFTWRDSHDPLVDLAQRWAAEPGGLVLAGDSSGGGLALALALGLRDRGGAQPTHLVLHAPWVDLTTSTPETKEFAQRDPWLKLSKVNAYARWWAGSEEDLGRPEVSPGLADLDGLPPGLMFYGTRDLLTPGCRLLARRAAASTWSLSYVEEPGLIHVYGLFPGVPEAERAFRRAVEFVQ